MFCEFGFVRLVSVEKPRKSHLPYRSLKWIESGNFFRHEGLLSRAPESVFLDRWKKLEYHLIMCKNITAYRTALIYDWKYLKIKKISVYLLPWLVVWLNSTIAIDQQIAHRDLEKPASATLKWHPWHVDQILLKSVWYLPVETLWCFKLKQSYWATWWSSLKTTSSLESLLEFWSTLWAILS